MSGYRAMAEKLLAETVPVAGRADLSNTQRLAAAQVFATLELAEQQRAANLLLALQHSALIEEQTDKRATSPAARYRVEYRNDMRRDVQHVVGHVVVMPTGDGE